MKRPSRLQSLWTKSPCYLRNYCFFEGSGKIVYAVVCCAQTVRLDAPSCLIPAHVNKQEPGVIV